MQNKFTPHILTLVLCLSSTTTYAATNPSLWGELDEEVPSTEQIQHEQKQLAEEQQAIASQKTVCELLSGQPTLSGDTANAAKIKEVLQQAYKTAMPDYKMFLVSNDAANNLYMQYRDLYIKTNCGGVAR